MLLAMIAALASAASEAPAAKPICQDGGPHMAGEPLPRAELRKLEELPPANLVLAVLRREDGCITPVIVRHGIGAAPAGDE
jgi:hypothetical protein